MIQLAEASHLSEIKQLTEACAKAMQEKGILQWNEFYPSSEKLSHDIEKEELYLLKKEGVIIGIIVLTPEMDEEYVPIQWLTSNSENLYVHRLATHPSIWGEGYGQNLMDFAEAFARKNRFQSVRLDTFSQNLRNQKFYEARGYKRLGKIYFPKQSGHPFYCYELVL
ncbi:N-acetyltransferase [Salinimicrobium marinum]|uniref:N-acetyltransferase n=1 Tax=Salinimicrobium marinum TaxID=680283 RepID=A0A918W0X8_9FLAO|nr:GNAT family N-acetyltransferase [Salinimicrobium marinum]GHA47133.1 N-acetyltransferase [Salinimicrobium marinum]